MNPLICMLDVGPNIWVYEYYNNRTYTINNYELIVEYIGDITKMIELQYELSKISCYEAVNVLLRKQLFESSKETAQCLLMMEESALYKSILHFIANQTIDDSSRRINRLTDPLKRVLYKINLVIDRLSDCKQDITLYKDLEYEILMKIFKTR